MAKEHSLPASPRRHFLSVPLCTVVFAAFFIVTSARAQDVAEAARQQQAKKNAEQKKQKHVYTNEDMKRLVILTPEDREEVQAKKNQNGVPLEQQADGAAVSAEATNGSTEVSLGEIARQYRKQKFLEELKRGEQSAEFHLPAPDAALASPKAPVFATSKAPVNSLIIRRPPQRPKVDFRAEVAAKRRSPFERTYVPNAPAIQPELKTPELPSMNEDMQPARPATPRIVAGPAPKMTSSTPTIRPNAKAPAIQQNLIAPTSSLLNEAAQPAAPTSPKFVPGPAPKISTSAPTRLPSMKAPVFQPSLKAPILPSMNESVRPAAPAMPTVVPAPEAKIAASSPSVAPAPKAMSPLEGRSVVVKAGDSLWKLAEQNLGRGVRWRELLAANPNISDPTKIAVGTSLVVPFNPTVAYHKLKPESSITVQKGDSLWTIAQAHFGHAAAWSCIAKANPEVADPNRIIEGQELILPSNCKTAGR